MKIHPLVALAFVPTFLYTILMLVLSRRIFLVGAGMSSSSWMTTTSTTTTTASTAVSPAHLQPQQTILRMSSSSTISSTTTPAANSVPKLEMPRIGLGTYMMDRDQIRTALPSAIAAGYRRIDCAPVYFNEDAVGDALAELLEQQQQQQGDKDSTPPQRTSIQRSDLYVVSKLPSPFHRNVEAAVRKTLNDLRLDYLDLYLVHWPVAFYPVPIDPTKRGWDNEDIDDGNGGLNIDDTVSVHETWRGMEDVLEQGLVRSIGVSNFPIMLLHELLSQARVKPVVNQCEAHPYLPNTKLLQYCHVRGIEFQAYSPLGTPGYKEQPEPNLLEDPVIVRIAEQQTRTNNNHQSDVTPSQICLAWALQRGTSVVVKSASSVHQKENLAALNITLNDEQMDAIAQLDRGYRFFRPEDWWGEKALAVFD